MGALGFRWYKKIEKIITDNEGVITEREAWGKKRLCYPIKHFNHGYYFLLEFDTPGKNLEKINNVTKITNEVLRFQIVARDKKLKEDIKKEKAKIKERETMAKADEKKKEDLKKEKARGKVNLKELDEKLDKILDTDDLLSNPFVMALCPPPIGVFRVFVCIRKYMPTHNKSAKQAPPSPHCQPFVLCLVFSTTLLFGFAFFCTTFFGLTFTPFLSFSKSLISDWAS